MRCSGTWQGRTGFITSSTYCVLTMHHARSMRQQPKQTMMSGLTLQLQQYRQYAVGTAPAVVSRDAVPHGQAPARLTGQGTGLVC